MTALNLSSLVVLWLLAFEYASGITCTECMCKVESGGCHPIGCRWDVDSLSCGYFQIKLPYYEDCYTPGWQEGETIDVAWKRCADDYRCAEKCVYNYNYRYGELLCPELEDDPCQQTARQHNGGPRGCASQYTLGYYEKVHECMCSDGRRW